MMVFSESYQLAGAWKGAQELLAGFDQHILVWGGKLPVLFFNQNRIEVAGKP